MVSIVYHYLTLNLNDILIRKSKNRVYVKMNSKVRKST